MRYVTKAFGDCDVWNPTNHHDVPTVIDSEPQFTGLLDSEGNAIYRTNDPIGFHFPE